MENDREILPYKHLCKCTYGLASTIIYVHMNWFLHVITLYVCFSMLGARLDCLTMGGARPKRGTVRNSSELRWEGASMQHGWTAWGEVFWEGASMQRGRTWK